MHYQLWVLFFRTPSTLFFFVVVCLFFSSIRSVSVVGHPVSANPALQVHIMAMELRLFCLHGQALYQLSCHTDQYRTFSDCYHIRTSGLFQAAFLSPPIHPDSVSSPTTRSGPISEHTSYLYRGILAFVGLLLLRKIPGDRGLILMESHVPDDKLSSSAHQVSPNWHKARKLGSISPVW